MIQTPEEDLQATLKHILYRNTICIGIDICIFQKRIYGYRPIYFL